MASNDLSKLIETYLGAWNETNPTVRRDLIAACWEADAPYLDPLFHVRGPEGFDGLIAGFQQQYPGITFVPTGEPEVQFHLVRFTWDLVGPDGSVQAKGTDIGLVSEGGRFASITGFFEQLPVLA